MKLADKIILLRKDLGWSQEELAEKLEVSRQSVSKWEGALSIPDLNKVIKLAQIFGVSTDYLLMDSIETLDRGNQESEERNTLITLDEANHYLQQTALKTWNTLVAIWLFIASVMPLFIFQALYINQSVTISQEIAISLGLAPMILLIAGGVAVLIRIKQKYPDNPHIHATSFELQYGIKGILEDKMTALGRQHSRSTIIGILLILSSVLPLILSAIYRVSSATILMTLVLMLVLIAIALGFIVPISATIEAHRRLLHEGMYHQKYHHLRREIAKITLVYWTLVCAIYIGWSLWTMSWGFTWLLWPVAALIFLAIIGWRVLTKDGFNNI